MALKIRDLGAPGAERVLGRALVAHGGDALLRKVREVLDARKA